MAPAPINNHPTYRLLKYFYCASMTHNKDTLYTSKLANIADFTFDDKVARVCPDMINRSIPGYASIITSIGLLAREHVHVGSVCYDLGCSLGTATLAMRQNIQHSDCRIMLSTTHRPWSHGVVTPLMPIQAAYLSRYIARI